MEWCSETSGSPGGARHANRPSGYGGYIATASRLRNRTSQEIHTRSICQNIFLYLHISTASIVDGSLGRSEPWYGMLTALIRIGPAFKRRLSRPFKLGGFFFGSEVGCNSAYPKS